MIDIHAHILPGMDDGAMDMQDTLKMAAMAVEYGITAMVATPHCNIPGDFENYYGDNYREVFFKVREAIQEEGIPLTLYPGMEVFVTPELPQLLRQGKVLTINGGHYILLEFAFEEDGDFVNDMLEEISALGLKPVIAHAERYQFLQLKPKLAREWYEKGYVIQCNKGSFTGRFGPRCQVAAYNMLGQGLVSVIASDAHSPLRRAPYMQDAYEELLDGYDPEYLDILFEENPRRICQDEPVVRF